MDKKEIMMMIASNAMNLMKMGLATGDRDLILVGEAAMISIAAVQLNKHELLGELINQFKDATEDEVISKMAEMGISQLLDGLPEELRILIQKAANDARMSSLEKEELPDDVKDSLRDLGIGLS